MNKRCGNKPGQMHVLFNKGIKEHPVNYRGKGPAGLWSNLPRASGLIKFSFLSVFLYEF